MACRALQLPPEAWLRMTTFNCSLTMLTIRPSGSVSLRALGDVGHLTPEEVTFSRHEGFSW
jgi:serine/threonine-protein phosphatase PGAM5